MNAQDEKLQELKETNKYFYRLTSPSPYESGQLQYLKHQLEKRGVDTTNTIEVRQHLTQMNINADEKTVKNITGHARQSNLASAGGQDASSGSAATATNHCTPEMITKYVEKLEEKKKRLAAQQGFKK